MPSLLIVYLVKTMNSSYFYDRYVSYVVCLHLSAHTISDAVPLLSRKVATQFMRELDLGLPSIKVELCGFTKSAWITLIEI